MNNIPKKLNDEINQDPFYRFCCLRDENCQGRIERHHNLIFQGRQYQKKFCILPACSDYHHKYANRKDIKEKLDQIMLNRASDQEILDISKAINYISYRNRLNEKYGFHS